MKQILTIFKKELIDTLRDRRTLIVMIIIPLLLFPLIFGVTASIQKNASDTESARLLEIGYVADGADLGLRMVLDAKEDIVIIPVADTFLLHDLIRSDSLDLGVSLENGFADKVEAMQTAEIRTFGATINDIALNRLKTELKIFKTQLEEIRLDTLGLSRRNITPVELDHTDTATKKESFGKIAGGFLPYIFIIFCYMGCMFPAIDLFTGEKERGTIETLLSAPVERWKVMVGKMMVVVLAGITTAILSLTGLFLSLQLVTGIPAFIMDIAMDILTPQFILSLIAMLLPLVIFFAGIMIPATVYAKSFKEASSILTPLNFLVILPAVVGMMPGIELNAVTAVIPVLNVVLTTKELIAGTVDGLLFAEVLMSLIVLASLAVMLSFRGFGSEKNIFRS